MQHKKFEIVQELWHTIKLGTQEYGTTVHGTVFLRKYKSHFNIFKTFNSRLKYLLLLILYLIHSSFLYLIIL